jgi:hypothetical protein
MHHLLKTLKGGKPISTPNYNRCSTLDYEQFEILINFVIIDLCVCYFERYALLLHVIHYLLKHLCMHALTFNFENKKVVLPKEA